MHVKLAAAIATLSLVASSLPSEATGYKYSSTAYYSGGHEHSSHGSRDASHHSRKVSHHSKKYYCKHFEQDLEYLVPVSMGRYDGGDDGYKSSGRHRKHTASVGRASSHKHHWGKHHFKFHKVRWCKHKPVSP